MAQDLNTLCELYFIFWCGCIWILYKFPDMIHVHWIMMLLWFPIFFSVYTTLVSDGWCIYIHLGAFVMVEYMALEHLLNAYKRLHKTQ